MTFRALRKCVNMGTTTMPMPPPNPALLTPVSHAPKQRITISVMVLPPFRWHKYSELLINCQGIVGFQPSAVKGLAIRKRSS